MEKRAAKTEATKRRKRKRRESPSSLPLDVISEILSKLPWKSVVRFRCFSKQWSSITKKPYFIKQFQTPSSTRPSLLICFKTNGPTHSPGYGKLFVFSIPQHNPNPNRSYSSSTFWPIYSYNIKHPQISDFTIKAETVHGLICFQRSTQPIIFNPTSTTRQFSILSKPDTSWDRLTVFLGYDPIEGKHKVLSMPLRDTCECRVLTLGSDEDKSWRRVKTDHRHRPLTGHCSSNIVCGRCINGVLYYQANIGNLQVIMRFNVKSEMFDMIVLPYSWGKNIRRMEMISYEGKLAFVDINENGITIWVLEDAEKRQWIKHFFSPRNRYYKQLKLVAITDDGELIFVPKQILNDIIYIDPKRGTSRKVTCKGLMDDDFRKRNGFIDNYIPVRLLQFFPNHIETSMSF